MFLGIDVGTGGTRALLVDREGRVVASIAIRFSVGFERNS